MADVNEGKKQISPNIPNPIVVQTNITFIKLPLGQNATLNHPNKELGKVYVPTAMAGILDILAGNNCKLTLHFKDGQPPDAAMAEEVMQGKNQIAGPDVHLYHTLPQFRSGWYVVRLIPDSISPGQAYGVSIMSYFKQDFSARDGNDLLVPWNFWYFPFSDFNTNAPHGFDNPGAFTRFDQHFQTSAFSWENVAHRHHGAAWEGHCDAGCYASIVFRQPQVPSTNPLGFVQEDLELFATEYCMRHNHTVLMWELPGDRNSLLHATRPTPATEITDAYAGSFHLRLYRLIGVIEDPGIVDLRDPNGANPLAVWNHVIYKYQAVFTEHPNAGGDEKDILVVNTITGNEDNNTPGNSDPENSPHRIEKTARYRLVFREDGTVNEQDSRQNWEAMEFSGHPPQYLPRYIYRIIDCSERNTRVGNPVVQFNHLTQLGIARRQKFSTRTFVNSVESPGQIQGTHSGHAS